MQHLRRSISYTKRPRLYIKDSYTAYNDLKVVIFGASSTLAEIMTGIFGGLGARITYPVRTSYKFVDYLKVGSTYRDVAIIQYVNYADPNIIDNLISDNNVVINMIGAPFHAKKLEHFVEPNIDLARRIAQSVAKNKDVSRFIHFSACGADSTSPSVRLQTKYQGEQEVKKYFPEATILRPCNMFGDGDNFAYRLAMMSAMFGYMPIVGDGSCLRQPIYYDDVALCLKNALRMEETVGKTYELGGPQVYTMEEIYEIIFDKMDRPPKAKSYPYWLMHRIMKYWPHHPGSNRFFNYNDVEESNIDIVVKEGALGCEELKVKPIPFPVPLKELLVDFTSRYNISYEQQEHGVFNGNDRHYS